MRASRYRHFALVGLCSFLATACAPVLDAETRADDAPSYSPFGTMLEFEFDSEFETRDVSDLRAQARRQLFFTVGQLMGSRTDTNILSARDGAASRVDAAQLRFETPEPSSDGVFHVRYHAVLPVLWGEKNQPSAASLQSYTFVLPRNVDALEAFHTRYVGTCAVDTVAARSIAWDLFWHVYRPHAPGCDLSQSEAVVHANATVRGDATSDGVVRYPEYDKLWADGVLRMTVVYQSSAGPDGVTRPFWFREILDTLLRSVPVAFSEASSNQRVWTQADPAVEDYRMTTSVLGRPVELAAFSVPSIDALDEAYAAASSEADVILYAGHAGYGRDVRGLLEATRFRPDQHKLLFLNSCSSLVYADAPLGEIEQRLGTLDVDAVLNAMPCHLLWVASTFETFVAGLLRDSPSSFVELLENLPPGPLPTVIGEHDNTFQPDAPCSAP